MPEKQSSTDGKSSLFIVEKIDGPSIKLDDRSIKDVQFLTNQNILYKEVDGTILINKDKVLAVYEYPNE